jgi:hypothetical protein
MIAAANGFLAEEIPFRVEKLKVSSIPLLSVIQGTARQITSTFPNPKSVMVSMDVIDYTPDVSRLSFFLYVVEVD